MVAAVVVVWQGGRVGVDVGNGVGVFHSWI
jgi:hypothetical protein